MDRSLAGESRRATAESGSDMSTTPQAEGQAASQAASPTGFTAVNGSRGSPQSSRASDNMSARPVTAESQPRDHTAATNGDGNYHQPHVSPLNGPVKRKRSVEGDAGEDMSAEEDESDSPEEENYIEDNEYGQRGDEPSRNVSYACTSARSCHGPSTGRQPVISSATTCYHLCLVAYSSGVAALRIIRI
jgi:hypothetical protein